MRTCFENYLRNRPIVDNFYNWNYELQNIATSHNRKVFEYCRVNCREGCLQRESILPIWKTEKEAKK